MAKFKVGDRVRFTEFETASQWERRHGGELGREFVIGKVYSSRIELRNLDGSYAFDTHFHQIASAEQSELERLVATANAGAEAQRKLIKECGEQIEHRWEGKLSNWANTSILGTPDGYVFTTRIKQKPAFEPFTVGPGWRVELVGTDRVRVGCREYDVKALRTTLERLCEQPNFNVSRCDGFEVYASRQGVSHDGQNISWADADKLLAALKKVGVSHESGGNTLSDAEAKGAC